MYESYLFTQLMPPSLLSYINADLGPDTRYPWIAISWNLGAAVIVTVGSRLSDIAGRRWFLIFGALAAAVGALVGATSQSITQSIISGIIFGLGGGFQEMCFACAQGTRMSLIQWKQELMVRRTCSPKVQIPDAGTYDIRKPSQLIFHSSRLCLRRLY